MKSKTIEEIATHTELTDGLKVIVRIAKGEGQGYNYFQGKVVGIGNNTINKSYLVECLDGFIPNSTYQFKVINIPYSELTIQ